jgi:hypothetical protein
MAFLFDALDLRWVYEPMSFLLPDGTHYMPDFWLPSLRLWAECRGYHTEKGARQIAGFAEWVHLGRITDQGGVRDAGEDYTPQRAVDYLVVGTGAAGDAEFHEYVGWFGNGRAGYARLQQCEECRGWCFTGEVGAYACRACHAWDGDGHIRRSIPFAMTSRGLGLQRPNGSVALVREWVEELRHDK